MTLFIILLSITALVVIYVLWLRKWLKIQPWAQGFYRLVDPIELFLFKKSETILWSRFLMLVGLLPPLLDQIKAFNIPEVMAIVPQQYVPYLSLSFVLCGMVSEFLRRSTTKPLEMVALPEVVSPEVKQAVQRVEATNADSVAVVAADKAAT